MKLTLQVYRPDTRRWVSHLTLAASDANERKIEAERERLEAAGYRVRERVGWWFRGGGGVVVLVDRVASGEAKAV